MEGDAGGWGEGILSLLAAVDDCRQACSLKRPVGVAAFSNTIINCFGVCVKLFCEAQFCLNLKA